MTQADHATSDPSPTDNSLAAALDRYHIELAAPKIALLDRYAQLLWEWNEKLNLTRHTSYERFGGRDVVDSLAFAATLREGERILDVGTGGGVPGVVLAIVRPDLKVTLIDSVGKKTRAVEDILRRLSLKAPVINDLVQEHLKTHRYDTLVVRAVARMDKVLGWLKPHRGAFDRLLLLKGPAWVEERSVARQRGLLNGFDLRRVAEYPLAGTDSQSVLLEIRSSADKPRSAAAEPSSATNAHQAPDKYSKTKRAKPAPRPSDRPQGNKPQGTKPYKAKSDRRQSHGKSRGGKSPGKRKRPGRGGFRGEK